MLWTYKKNNYIKILHIIFNVDLILILINKLAVFKGLAMTNNNELNSSANESSALESPEEKKRRFLMEFENPFKCDKCNERFKKKKYLREHKSEVHSY